MTNLDACTPQLFRLARQVTTVDWGVQAFLKGNHRRLRSSIFVGHFLFFLRDRRPVVPIEVAKNKVFSVDG